MFTDFNIEAIFGRDKGGAGQSLAVSRRGFLGMGLLTASAAAIPWSREALSFCLERGILIIRRFGSPVWDLDPRRFSGDPRVFLERSGDRITFGLTDARFPGLALAADFSCELEWHDSEWVASWAWQFARSRFRFGCWLERSETVTFHVPRALTIDATAIGHRVSIAQDAHLTFTPDWRFQTAQAHSVDIVADQRHLQADDWVLRLPDREPSFLTNTASRFTQIDLVRGGKRWGLHLPAIGNGRLESAPQPFERIAIQFLDDHPKRPAVASVAISAPTSQIRFLPGQEFRHPDGTAFDVPLEDMRFVFASGGCSDAAVFARTVPGVVPMTTAGLDLRVGAEQPVDFTWTKSSSGSALRFDLPLVGISAPLDPSVSAQVSVDPNLSALRFGSSSEGDVPLISISEIEVLRPDDLLELRFELFNLALAPARRRSFFDLLRGRKHPALLRPLDPTKPSFVVVHLAPQHVAEKSIFEDSSGNMSVLPLSPVGARFADPSRLAFRLPEGVDSIPYTMAGLLDWARLDPSIVPVAQSAGSVPTDTTLRAPTATETALEIPFRLILSPNERSAWAHRTVPHSRRDTDRRITWTELWHSRLGVKSMPGTVDEESARDRTLRAVFARRPGAVGNATPPPPCQPGVDPPQNPGPGEGLDALSTRDHYEIVQLTANFTNLRDAETQEMIDPIPIGVEQLMISSQGAWLSSQGNWGPTEVLGGSQPEILSLREWRQETSQARDQYVRAVYGGFIYPYGHQANLIQITERKFQRRDAQSPLKAYLRQRIYITIEEPVKSYDDLGLDPQGRSVERQNAFRTITATTLITPNLDRPTDLSYPCFFWARVLQQPFLFHFIGTDWAGKPTNFSAPIIFVNYNQRRNGAAIETVRDAYEKSGEWRRNLAGQKVAFAPSASAGDTDLEAAFLYFSGYPAPHPPDTPPAPAALAVGSAGTDQGICCAQQKEKVASKPPWKPHSPKAEVKVPGASGIGGPSTNVNVPITWDDSYLRNGFTPSIAGPNVGELFAKLENPISFGLPSTRSVGLFKPDFDISGLSRKFGSVGGDLENLKLGNVDFGRLFPRGGSAKIFGFFDLADLLGGLDSSNIGSLGAGIVPDIKTRVINDGAGLPERVENYMDWSPRLQRRSISVVTFTPSDNVPAFMQVVVATQVRTGASTFKLEGRIEHFTLRIESAIEVEFKKLSFVSEQGRPLSVAVDVGRVQFLGGLAFLKKLQEQFGSTIFGPRGPRIAIEGLTLVASAGFALPNISFGVFSLRKLRLGTRLLLPLTGGDPFRIGIDLGARNDPFLASVTIFGGGGNLSLTIGPEGVDRIEFSIQAGGVVALDLAVAHGSAYVLIGVGMEYDRTTEAGRRRGLILRLFLRAGGCLDILGLITVSVEFTLTFEYRAGQGTVCAICTVTVSIEMLFFSFDVHVTLERCLNLGGDSSDAAPQTLAEADRPRINAAAERAYTFDEFVTRQDWAEYCRAFGPAGG